MCIADICRVEWVKSIFTALCNLAGVPIVSVEALREVWPRVTFRERRHDPGVEMNVTRSTPSREEAPYIEIAKRYVRQRDGLSVDEVDGTEVQRQAEELLRRIRVPATEETLEALAAHHSLLGDLLRQPHLFGFFFEIGRAHV